jgi:hypothetical protein
MPKRADMTKLTNTLNRVLTAGAAMALSLGLAMPAQAMSVAELIQLKQDTAYLADRTETPGFAMSGSASASTGANSVRAGIMGLELFLQFPAAGLASTTGVDDYSSYELVTRAITTRNTMLLRACTIAEEAAPPANLRLLSYGNLAQRVSAIQAALQLYAPTHRPSRSELSYGTVMQMNAEVEDMMAMLGDYVQLDTSVDMSSWYYHQLLTIMWQNAKDACELYSD